jgi:hypothetical protein
MIKQALVGIFACIAFFISSASAAELSKEEAKKLLERMGDENVVIVAVVSGVGLLEILPLNGPNVAMVFAYRERKGKPTKKPETFLYDKDLGWFFSEFRDKDVAAWTAAGFKTFKPEAKPK